ncbi:MAG: pentapeptide repeat-containing protein [Acidimicrobiales bacterium]
MANQSHQDRAQQGREAWNHYVNTQGSDFRADLGGAGLSKARLSRANLRGADLAEAVLRRADLNGARLSLADLARADLTGANLRGAHLSGANLSLADLTGVNLTRADLSGADLSRAKFNRADLARADLTGASLRRADLSGARDLGKARLRDAEFDADTRWPAGFDPDAAGAIAAVPDEQPEPPPDSDRTGPPGGDGRDATPTIRVDALGAEAQSEARRRLEPVTGELQRLVLDDASLSEEEQAYLRGQLGTLREQLRLEFDGDTRIIELAIANITTRFSDRLHLGEHVREILVEIDTRPPALIDEIVERLNLELARSATLGGADPVDDGRTLVDLGSSMAQLEELVSTMVVEMEDHVVNTGIRHRSTVRGFFGGLATSLAASGVEGSWQGVAIRLLTALQELVRWFTTAA